MSQLATCQRKGLLRYWLILRSWQMAYDEYETIHSDMGNMLKSPDLRHLAWNIGERLNVPRRERAKFILASFLLY